MLFVITGNRKGIGRHLTDHYLEKGHIVVGCSRSESDLMHERYMHFSLDVSDEAAVKDMVTEIRRKYQTVDVLINNAGIASMNHFLLTPTDNARRVMDVNFFGTFIFSREIARLMRKAKEPRIVNFTTVARPLNLQGEAVYAASKAAVESLTKIMAKELAQYSITVNAIGPSPIKTDLIAGIPGEKLDDLLGHQAIKKFGTFEDVLNIADFFIRPESRMITGQILYLGGIG